MRIEVGQQPVRAVAHRQAPHHLRQQREVEPLGCQLAACDGAASVTAPLEGRVARGPAHAIRGHEPELLDGEFRVSLVLATRQATGHLGKPQWVEPRLQSQRHLAQRDIQGCGRDTAVDHIDPGTQRTLPLRQIERKRRVLAQRADIDAGQRRVNRPAPALPVGALGQQRLCETPGHAESIAPVGGGRRIDAHVVMAQ